MNLAITDRPMWTHAGERPHRAVERAAERTGLDDHTWKLGNRQVILVQMTPRGLWRFTPVPGDRRDEYDMDEKYGEMPLRVALTRLRMGV